MQRLCGSILAVTLAALLLAGPGARAQTASDGGFSPALSSTVARTSSSAAPPRPGRATRPMAAVQSSRVSSNVFINGRPAALVGHRTACGGVIVAGASSVTSTTNPPLARAIRRRAARQVGFFLTGAYGVRAVFEHQGGGVLRRAQPGGDKLPPRPAGRPARKLCSPNIRRAFPRASRPKAEASA